MCKVQFQAMQGKPCMPGKAAFQDLATPSNRYTYRFIAYRFTSTPYDYLEL